MDRRCLICNLSSFDYANYLLTCQECNRSWHHRCRQPPLSDDQLNALFNKFLAGSQVKDLPWTCPKCVSRKNAPPSSSVSILDVDLIPPPSRNTAAEIVDLTEPVEIIDLSPDSPSSVILVEPEPVAPMDVDIGELKSELKSEPLSQFHLLKIDPDQKPISLLLGNVPNPPAVPAWLRERCEASSFMSALDSRIQKDRLTKPLSRRKPSTTRFAANTVEPFVLL